MQHIIRLPISAEFQMTDDATSAGWEAASHQACKRAEYPFGSGMDAVQTGGELRQIGGSRALVFLRIVTERDTRS